MILSGRRLFSKFLDFDIDDNDDDDGDDDDGDDDDDDDDDDGDDWMLDHHLPSPAPPPLHLLSSSHRLHLL